MRRLFWDFTGPIAEGTAAHFKRHLDEFLEREAIEGCTTGLEGYGPMHHAAWCDTPSASEDVLIRTLRPRRATDPEPDPT